MAERIPSSSSLRFNDREIALILRRAAELQEGADAASTMSLGEIQEIAAEAGIGPEHVARAAAELTRTPPRSGWLGAPTRFRDERVVEGELPTSVLGELVDVVRQEVGLHGEVSSVLDALEWRARAVLGVTLMTIAPRAGGTRIAVTEAREDHAALVVAVSVGVGLTAGVAGVLLGIAVTNSPIVVSVIGASAMLGGTLLSARAMWQGIAARCRRQTRAIADAIAERAAQLVAADRLEQIH